MKEGLGSFVVPFLVLLPKTMIGIGQGQEIRAGEVQADGRRTGHLQQFGRKHAIGSHQDGLLQTGGFPGQTGNEPSHFHGKGIEDEFRLGLRNQFQRPAHVIGVVGHNLFLGRDLAA